MATSSPIGSADALTPAEWRRVAWIAAVVLGLHLAGVLLLLLFAAPLGATGGLGVGVGVTAYTLGLRHAFDADHLAAIDGTTRKLMADGRRPLSVGFCFSLGHSSVVLALSVLVWLGVRGLDGAVADESSLLQQATGVIGPLVSGSFLLLIGVLNLTILLSVARTYRRVRRGRLDERRLAAQLDQGGALVRVYGRAARSVRTSWHMYPVGVLFGLGFDTATEVALLVLAGGAAAGDVPLPAILCLPILFAAGMSLLDTIDGILMNLAYRQPFSTPVRRARYNLAITGLTVAIALLIGGAELVTVLAHALGLSGGIWDAIAGVNLELLGYLIVATFVAMGLLTVAARRVGQTLAAKRP